MRIYRLALTVLFMCVLFSSCRDRHRTRLLKYMVFSDYPSASAIEYADGKYYLIGDDAPYLMVLNNELKIIDTIEIWDTKDKRIPKDIKPDLEAMTFINTDEGTRLLIIGSGSNYHYRNIAWLIDPETRSRSAIRLDSLYAHFKQKLRLAEINVEGASTVNDYVVLANRGHFGWKNNHLLFIPVNYFAGTDSLHIEDSFVVSNRNDTIFSGVSGITWADEAQTLIMTLSTEFTSSAYEDGSIGKSYLAFFENFYEERRPSADSIIDLSLIDQRFVGQKIESVCVVKEEKKYFDLGLVADNDNGSSTMFVLRIRRLSNH